VDSSLTSHQKQHQFKDIFLPIKDGQTFDQQTIYTFQKKTKQEAQLLQMDCMMHYVSWNLVKCHTTIQKNI